MNNKIKQWIENCRELIGSLLFPTRCPVCDEILSPEEKDKGIHLACEGKLYFVQGAVCMHCGRPFGDNNPHKEYCYDCIGTGYAKESYILQGKSLFLYKGAAKKMMKFLKNPKHLILTSAHPSPLSAYNGFFGNNHFIKTNEFLKNNNREEINWIKK